MLTLKTRRRFWSKVRKTKSCWFWHGTITKGGYGRIYVGGRQRMAHRVSWKIHKGPIPKGLFVLHECDNRSCVRPSHLFIGTQQDNIDDMWKKGRGVSVVGEKHGMAKLTEEQVIRVLKWNRKTGHKLNKFCDEFGVSHHTLAHIRCGDYWNHLYHYHSKFGGRYDGISAT